MDDEFKFYIPKDIYGFAFVKNISAKTLYKIKNLDACYLLSGQSSIDKYLEFLLHEQPKNILGLGMYSGLDQDKIRVETLVTNKFRNSYIESSGNDLIKYQLEPFFEKDNNFKISNAIENSYCNMACFKIYNLISLGKLNSKLTFLHIPKSMKYWEVARLIDQKLIKFKRTIN